MAEQKYIDKIVKDEEEYDIIGKLKRYPVTVNFPATETDPLQGTANWTKQPSDDDMSFILDMSLQQDGTDQGNFKLVASKFIGTQLGTEDSTPMIYTTFSFDGTDWYRITLAPIAGASNWVAIMHKI